MESIKWLAMWDSMQSWSSYYIHWKGRVSCMYMNFFCATFVHDGFMWSIQRGTQIKLLYWQQTWPGTCTMSPIWWAAAMHSRIVLWCACHLSGQSYLLHAYILHGLYNRDNNSQPITCILLDAEGNWKDCSPPAQGTVYPLNWAIDVLYLFLWHLAWCMDLVAW